MRGSRGTKWDGRDGEEREESICMCFYEEEKGERERRRQTMCACVLVSVTSYSFYFNSSPIPSSLSPSNFLHSSFKPTESTQCCLYVHGYRNSYQSLRAFRNSIPKENCLSYSSHKVSIGPQLQVNPSPICAQVLANFVICKSCAQSHSLCEFMCAMILSCPSKLCFFSYSLPLLLTVLCYRILF